MPFAGATWLVFMLVPIGSHVKWLEYVMALVLTLAVFTGIALTPWQRAPAALRLVPPAVFLAAAALLRDAGGAPPASVRCSASPSSRHTKLYIVYEVYIAPGLMAMIQLFNGMQSLSSSWSTTARWAICGMLLVSPAAAMVPLVWQASGGNRSVASALSVYAFLLIAWFWDIAPPPALISHGRRRRWCYQGLMLGALGMLTPRASSSLRTLPA